MSERGSARDNITIPTGFVSLQNCEELAEFDQFLSGGVSDIDRDSNEAVHYLSRLYDDFYSNIFQDVALYRGTKDFTRTWTSWDRPSDFANRMIDAWKRVLSGQETDAYYDQFLYNLYSSRPERWQRLSEMLGIGTPDGFHLFRGMYGEHMVRAVSEEWLDETHDAMRVPSRLLSSWSMSRAAGREYSFDRHPNASVLFSADIQFANTLADKWVDDGSFIVPCFRECEVIVATADIDEIVVAKQDVEVMLNYKAYRFEDRHELANALGK